jgi:hypothetical protein
MVFTYFDLGSRSYKTITSPEIMVNVLEGPNAADNAVAATPGDSKKAILSSAQFKFIKLKTELTSMKHKDFYGSTLFYILSVLPFLCIPVIVLFKKKKEAIDGDVAGNKIKLSNKLAKKYLSEAQKEIGNKEPFYIALEKAMHNFLKAKINIETSEMSKEKISEILLERKANPDAITSFINLTENCEFARYAPSSSTAIQQDYDKAVAIISELEKQIV